MWKELIRKRPVVAFYALCYAISFGLWLPRIIVRNDIFELLGIIGVFGPALACVFVARVTPRDSDRPRARHPWIPFVIAWGASTLIFAANIPTILQIPPVVFVFFAALALVPAYVISSAFSGPPGVRETLSSLIHPRGWWGWYLLAVLLPPTTKLLSSTLSQYMGWELLTRPTPPSDPLKLIGSILVVFLYTLLYAGGLNEEVGWTGAALPKLLARHNPLIATLVVWFFWILWHVPLRLAGLFDLNLHVLIGTFFGRFIFTWLYIRSSGGMLTGILFHTSVNTASQFIPNTYTSLWVEAGIALVIVIGSRMWRRMPALDLKVQEIV